MAVGFSGIVQASFLYQEKKYCCKQDGQTVQCISREFPLHAVVNTY